MRSEKGIGIQRIGRRTMRFSLSICIVLPLIAACERGATPSGADPTEVAYVAPVKADITPEEAKALLDANDGHVYLDVRTVVEFTAGHIPGSMNVPYIAVGETGERGVNQDFLAVVQATLAKNAKIIVGCKSGSRSKRAQGALQGAGYKHVSNVAGGFGGSELQPGWSSLDYPIESGDGGENSYAALRSKAAP